MPLSHAAQTSLLKEALNRFIKAYEQKGKKSERIGDIIDAVENAHVIHLAEPWLNQEQRPLAHEMLFRYHHHNKGLYRYTYFKDALEKFELIDAFDLMNIFNILTWLPDVKAQIAATINVSHDILTNSEACELIMSGITQRQNKNVIFEILEDYRQFNTDDLEKLNALKSTGLSFALDDFRVSVPSDWKRLKSLNQIIDFVKLDGEISVRPFLTSDKDDLKALKQHIEHVHNVAGSDKLIICEWVQNMCEAEKLFDLGVHAIQGHDL